MRLSRIVLMSSQLIPGKFGPLVGAIDQGTSSTRFLVFATKTAELLTYHQEEVPQIYPEKGWVEQKPQDYLNSVYTCINKAVENLKSLEIDPGDIQAVGITNQRETTIVWDKRTGKPLHNAIVWLDTRTSKTVDEVLEATPGRNQDYVKEICGLPISTYFSALKLKWLFQNVDSVKTSLKDDSLLFGTVDTWLLWNLSGGCDGGLHITDVTNASRTMLMNLRTQDWDDGLCKFFDVPKSILPQIRSSSEIYGYITKGPLEGVPISGLLGDQQAALVGQMCLKKGQAKITFGTGAFLLNNTGTQVVHSANGLLTTVAYKLGKDAPVCFALEGSVAIAGAAVQWLRDNLKIIEKSSDIEGLVQTVKDTGGVYFVPAFSGLYAPYWRSDARGVICGLSQHSTGAHIARATLEAVCFQTKEIVNAMQEDSGISISSLLVDGGMTANNTMLQLQADLLGIPVGEFSLKENNDQITIEVRPSMTETTALGAAMAAGSAEGVAVWDLDKVTSMTTEEFTPAILAKERDERFERWMMAIDRCLGWNLPRNKQAGPVKEFRRLSSVPPALFLVGSFFMVLLAERICSNP